MDFPSNFKYTFHRLNKMTINNSENDKDIKSISSWYHFLLVDVKKKNNKM